jgi:hypothetical protein
MKRPQTLTDFDPDHVARALKAIEFANDIDALLLKYGATLSFAWEGSKATLQAVFDTSGEAATLLEVRRGGRARWKIGANR